jgi:hypothetical protein
MSEKRQNIRYKTDAIARFPGTFKGDSLLKNLSVTGCSIESEGFLKVEQGVEYTLEIIPEGASGIKSFELQAEVRWIRNKENFCEAGFMITASPVKKEFERYVDYLAWRSESE